MERIRLDVPDEETCIVELTLRRDLWAYYTQLLAESGLKHLEFSFVRQNLDNFRAWESMAHVMELQAV